LIPGGQKQSDTSGLGRAHDCTQIMLRKNSLNRYDIWIEFSNPELNFSL
jgi:hypothetical protein